MQKKTVCEDLRKVFEHVFEDAIVLFFAVYNYFEASLR